MAGRRFGALVGLALLFVGLHPAPARAEGLIHVVGAANATSFTPGTEQPLRVIEGDRLLLVNHDIPWESSEHDLVHSAPEPSFETGVQTVPGQTAEVFGVDELPPGTYPFVCSVHYLMKGTLVVEPAPV